MPTVGITQVPAAVAELTAVPAGCGNAFAAIKFAPSAETSNWAVAEKVPLSVTPTAAALIGNTVEAQFEAAQVEPDAVSEAGLMSDWVCPKAWSEQPSRITSKRAFLFILLSRRP